MVIKEKSIGTILACFIVLWLNAGNFDFLSDKIPIVAKFGVVLLWLIIAIDTDRGFLSRYIHIATPVFITLFFLIVSNLFGRTAYYDAYFMLFMYLAIIQALFAYYFFDSSADGKRIILFVFIVDLCIVTIHTFVLVLQNPIIVRAMSTSAEMRSQLLQNDIPNGIGGYGLCYQLAFFTPCVAYIFNEKIRNSLVKWLLYIAIIISLFQFQIAMALIFSVIFIFGIEIIRQNGSNKNEFFIKIAFMVLLFVIISNFSTIIELVIKYANTDLENRLNELLLIRSNGIERASDINSRMRLYTISTYTFFDNPLWGTFGKGTFGGHSTFLDILASFGVIGFAGIYGICRPLILSYKMRYKGSIERRYIFCIIAVFIVFATLNVALSSDILLACNLMIPLIFEKSRDEIEKV